MKRGQCLIIATSGTSISNVHRAYTGSSSNSYFPCRAPCANDKCLFLTNIDPFPSPRSVYYANNITHVHEQEAKFNQLNFPSNDFWDKHAYHTAVDTDANTCW